MVAAGDVLIFSATAQDLNGDQAAIEWHFSGGTPAASSVEDTGEVCFATMPGMVPIAPVSSPL